MFLLKDLKEKNKYSKNYLKTTCELRIYRTSKKNKNLQTEWTFLQTENSELERDSETSAETSNTAYIMLRTYNATSGNIASGNVLLTNRDQAPQSVRKHKLHKSELSLSREGWRCGQRIGKNHFLLSKPDSPLWEKSSWKLNGSPANLENAQWAKKMTATDK